MPRIVYLTANPKSMAWLLEGQLKYFREHGHEVIAITAPSEELDLVATREGVQTIGVNIVRSIRPLADLLTVLRLARVLRKLRPDIVNASNMKGGLVGMLAAWLARVPVRVYLLRGLALETTSGVKRKLYWLAEVIAAACSHRVIAVSDSLRRSYLEFGCTRPEKITVLGHGSSNGIVIDRFFPTPEIRAQAAALRRKWNLDESAPVVGFAGRFNRDKGLPELLDAFDEILKRRPDAWLLLVGDFESVDPVSDDCIRRIASHPRIVRTGHVTNMTSDLAAHFAAMDVLLFPTYREGFPNILLEAAVVGLPVVAFAVTGVVDAVSDGVTGTLVPVRDARAMGEAAIRYLDDGQLRAEHGQAARDRVCRDFRREVVWEGFAREYAQLLGKSAGTAACSASSANPQRDG